VAAQAPTLPTDVQAEISKAVAEHMREQRIPGLSLAVGRAGRVVFAKGYGAADLEHDVPVTSTTLFRLQSTQKLLTATAVLRLAELERLRLDDPVQRHVVAIASNIEFDQPAALMGELVELVRKAGAGADLAPAPATR